MTHFKKRSLLKNISLIMGGVCIASTHVYAQETIEQRLEKLEQALEKHNSKENGQHILNNIRFAGLVQMDFNQYDGAYNASKNGRTGSDVFVRRVHLRLFHKASDELDYVMLLLADDDTTKFLVGFARYQPNKTTELRIGKIKEDRSFSVQYIGEELTGERPMVANAFATAFQWGVQGHKLLGQGIRVSAGVFEDKKYAGNKDGRDDNNKLLLGYNIRGTWGYESNDLLMHLGASYALRDLGKESFALSEQAGIRRATNKLAVSPTISSAEDVSIILTELAIQKGAFRIEGEYGVMDVDALSTTDHSFNGYYLSANYFIDGKTHLAYNHKYAKFGRPSNENGVWEVYGRYSVLDLVDNNAGSKAEVSMLGATYYLNTSLHFQLQYYQTDVSGPYTKQSFFSGDDGKNYHDGNAIAARVSYRF